MLDPFPDYSQHLVGYPDKNQAKSVVQKLKKSFTLACPASVVSPTYDAVIWFSGNLYPGNTRDGSNNYQGAMLGSVGSDGSVNIANGSTSYPLHTVTSYVVPAGTDVFPSSSGWVENNQDRFSGLSFDEFVVDRTRLIGGGIEVTNTTPELYRGGMIGVADVSSASVEITGTVLRGDVNNLRTVVNTALLSAPPANIAQFQQLSGKVRWGAEEGCYAVLKMNKEANDFEIQRPAVLSYMPAYPGKANNNPIVRAYGVVSPGTCLIATTASADVPKQVLAYPPISLLTPFDLKVIYLTGCDSHSTFTIDVNLIIESIPDTNDMRMLSLAAPAAPVDNHALELYSKVITDLPAAVPVAENAGGGWFSDLCDVVADWAPTVGSFFGPTGTAIGGGVAGLAKMSKGFVPKKNQDNSTARRAENNTIKTVNKSVVKTEKAKQPKKKKTKTKSVRNLLRADTPR